MRGMLGILSVCVVALSLVAIAAGERGGVDSSFGGDGTVRIDLGGSESVSGVAIQPNGAILVGGSRYERARAAGTGFLLRLARDGTVDTSFAGDGRVDVPEAVAGGAVARQADGKIVFAGGRYGVGGGMDFYVARFNPDGSPDGGFGSGGSVTTDIAGGASDFPFAVIVRPDGRIVVAGDTSVQSATSDANIAVARYLPSGSLDPSFGGDGSVVTDLGGWDVGLDVAASADGRIVVAGYKGEVGTSKGLVAATRYTVDGALDPTFDGDGIVVTQHPHVGHGGVALQTDGRPVLTAGPGLTLLRLTASGRPDASFGGDGAAVASNATAVVGDVAVQPNGKVVVFGSVDSGDSHHFVLARFLPDGRSDPSMPVEGAAADVGHQEWALVVAVAGDGRIVGGGMSLQNDGSSGDAALARYLPGTCHVPNVRGKSLAAARAGLAAANCRLGRVRAVLSKTVTSGRIVSQSTAAGREAPDWAIVNVTVSRGRR